MTDSISFINASWTWYVIGIAIFVYVLFLLKEWYQSKTHHFLIKAIAAFLGIFALSMIALKPAIQKDVDVSKMAILTENYNEATLDSLKNIYKNLRLTTYKKGQPIVDKTNLPSSVFVLGEGIASFDLWQLDSTKTTFLNDSKLSGITRLSYKQEYVTGEKAIISGLYNQPTQGHKLLLENPGGKAVDSVVLDAETSQAFEFSTELNIKGKYVYTITEKDSLNRIINSNAIPIKINEQNALRILIINGFPTFETKYLKNYLAEMGHSVVVRSQITKGRFKYEYFNIQNRPQTTLTQNNLEQFDLVTIDANSLLNLSRTQRTNLENAIKDDGLGVLIQPTSRLFRASSNLIPFTFNSDRVSEMVFPNSQNIKLSKHPYYFKSDTRLQTIHGNENKTYSGYIHFGSGRISTTVFENTFELVLNGKQKTYKNLWSTIITTTSKRKIQTLFWEQHHLFAFKDEPFTFKLRTNLEAPEVKSGFGYAIPIQQHIDISSVWEGRTYPKYTGWQKQIVVQDTTQAFHYFVNASDDWKALQAYSTIKANSDYSKNSLSAGLIQTRQEPIRPIWFFIVSLICFGYLWLVPKL